MLYNIQEKKNKNENLIPNINKKNLKQNPNLLNNIYLGSFNDLSGRNKRRFIKNSYYFSVLF